MNLAAELAHEPSDAALMQEYFRPARRCCIPEYLAHPLALYVVYGMPPPMFLALSIKRFDVTKAEGFRATPATLREASMVERLEAYFYQQVPCTALGQENYTRWIARGGVKGQRGVSG